MGTYMYMSYVYIYQFNQITVHIRYFNSDLTVGCYGVHAERLADSVQPS